MTATALKQKTSILRTAAGEPPLGPDGLSFRADQGEIFEPETISCRSMMTRIGVLELNTGKWLSFPFGIDRPHHATRGHALRQGIAGMVRKARRYMRAKDGEGTHWTEGFAGRVIEWALSLKPEQAVGAADILANPDRQTIEGTPALAEPDGAEEITSSDSWCNTLTAKMASEELTIAGYEASDAGSGLSDPVVKYLVEQHALRKQFPAKHIFSMTTEVADGRIVTVATCACKQVFKFGSNDVLRMNAAIEAHWRRFSHEPTVDGRGQPIGEKKPKRKKKSNVADVPQHPRSELASNSAVLPLTGDDDAGSPFHSPEAGGYAEPQGPAPERSFADSGAGEIQGAQICAGDAKCVGCVALPWLAYPDSPLLQAALALAWREEVAPPDPVKQFEAALPALMGPEEKRRKLAEFKLALKQRPVNLGPLFGTVPSPSADELGEVET